MTVSELIKELMEIEQMGYGNSLVRAYSEAGGETYRPIELTVHPKEENKGWYDESYGDWVEVG